MPFRYVLHGGCGQIPSRTNAAPPSGSNPGEEHQSDVEASSESSSSESDEESSDTERSKNGDDNENQSRDEGGNGGHPADLLNAEDLLSWQVLPGSGDGNAKEAEQNPSQERADDAANAPVNQASLASARCRVAMQTLRPPQSLERLQPTASEHSQQEQPQDQAMSNAREQVQVELD